MKNEKPHPDEANKKNCYFVQGNDLFSLKISTIK